MTYKFLLLANLVKERKKKYLFNVNYILSHGVEFKIKHLNI